MTVETTAVTADELEAMAYATGREITLAPDRAVLSIGGVIFVAPLIPAQRQPSA